MKKIILTMCAICIALSTWGQGKKNSNPKPYPLGNPVIQHMYTADAAPHVMPDGCVWMVTSVDHEDGGGYSTMQRYHTFSTSDMKTWVDHGEVLHINDLVSADVATKKNEMWALWAPDVVYRNGKYYLYFPVRILHTDKVREDGGRVVTSYIGVAESDALNKRFKVINPHIKETKGIDPAVFIDDDGTPFLYWGQQMVAKLKDNMYELAEEPVKLDVGTDKFMEAIWMNKRGGKYHLSYHTKYNTPITLSNFDDPMRKKSELAYSVGDSPYGPFQYGGTLNYELGVNVDGGPRHPNADIVPWRLTQSNHGGIVEYHGQDYLFYHTSALSSWRQDEFKGMGTWTQRSVCVDKINYSSDGKVMPVKQTVEGVEAVSITQPHEILLQQKQTTIADKNRQLTFKKVDMGTGYYYFGLEAGNVKEPVKAQIRVGSPIGKLCGTVLINGNGIAETFLREAVGKQNLYIVFDKGGIDVKNLRLYAGSQK